MFSADHDLLNFQALGSHVNKVLRVDNIHKPFCAGKLHLISFKRFDFQLASYCKYKTKPLLISQVLYLVHAGDSACLKFLAIAHSPSSTTITMIPRIEADLMVLVDMTSLTPPPPRFWLGVELDQAHGKNDGSRSGVKYFKCKPNHGVFVLPSKVKR